MNETHFHALADAHLTKLHDRLEPAFDRGELEELELLGGILTIITASGKTFLISKHAPSMQLWLASPISGGLHFSHNAERDTWELADGRALTPLLQQELASQHVTVDL